MSIWPFKEEWHGIQWRELSGDISETVTMGSLMHVLVTVLSLTPSSHMTYPHNQIIKSIWENLNLAKWNATIHSLIYFYISLLRWLLLGFIVSRTWMKPPSGLFLTSHFHQTVEIKIIWSCGEPLTAQHSKSNCSVVFCATKCSNQYVCLQAQYIYVFPCLTPHFLHV